MKNNWLIKWIGLGIVSASVSILAQQKVALVPPTEPKPNFGSVVGRPDGAMPKVPAGFSVELYADNVAGARIMEFAANGDLFVAQSAQNGIMVLRDTNTAGKPDQLFT